MTPTPSLSLSPDVAWQAVLAHDRALDGAFVYAVRTTGIYCRPSCPSRRPRREHVDFFVDGTSAERAGYRACARCGPAAPAGRAARAVERAAAFLEAHLDERVTLAALARQVGLSPFHLQRTFRRVLGVSPRAFQDARRLSRFKQAVRAGATVGDATFAAGYGSARGLYESARGGLGMTPATYRRGGRGERLRFATTTTAAGELLVAASDRGICAVSLGDGAAALEAALREEFPTAEVVRDDAGLSGWIEAVARQVTGRPAPELPLDLRGTAFQLKVWRALRDIAPGETRSYGEVAAAVGDPAAARAVARACASNRVALVVPCHRVVPAGGGTGGYRWGGERKAALLAAEASAHAEAPPSAARRPAQRGSSRDASAAGRVTAPAAARTARPRPPSIPGRASAPRARS